MNVCCASLSAKRWCAWGLHQPSHKSLSNPTGLHRLPTIHIAGLVLWTKLPFCLAHLAVMYHVLWTLPWCSTADSGRAWGPLLKFIPAGLTKRQRLASILLMDLNLQGVLNNYKSWCRCFHISLFVLQSLYCRHICHVSGFFFFFFKPVHRIKHSCFMS